MNTLQARIGYQFKDTELLKEALTHPSFVPGSSRHYERLELLGDSVVNLLVSEYLLANYRDEKEGDIAKRRAALVCRDSLASIARLLELGQVIFFSDSEAQLGGRDNPANLENAFEALAGAIYMDGGLEAARTVLLPYFVTLSSTMLAPPRDAKTTLQEWLQASSKSLPNYVVLTQDGPPHAPVFTVEVQVGEDVRATGTGATKRAAEQEAAKEVLIKLGVQ
ncbi:MAG: ribonuclease III [Proteobacteria bacterium]|nr:ribonuclease III [Pseudomonadota bacterium]